MIPNISVTELLKQYNPNIIDIRSMEKYNNNHIPGSINIPVEKLLTNPEKYMNHLETYYIYCEKGLTSGKVCRMLWMKQYKAVNILGGYESWITGNNN